MSSQDQPPGPLPSPAKTIANPVLRNALRYTISAQEYKTLHQYLVTRSPAAVRRRAPPPSEYHSLVQAYDDYNAATFRAALRVFITTETGLEIWELFKAKLLSRGTPQK